ncbi:hypothetical protein [Ornithinimicrobium panacihumi]|uniref:hypothetical protein n=1 Tax=Ornithinimicrobium panacihumi TaxID=2008449 RepID=UPI003F8973FD
MLEDIVQLALLTYETVNALAGRQPRPTLVWNDELDPSRLIGRTALLADHVLTPDLVLSAATSEGTEGAVSRAASALLAHAPLIEMGAVIPSPNGVVAAARGPAVEALTRADLKNDTLRRFVESQLVFEGPTAREVLFVSAKDDLKAFQDFWMYARVDPQSVDADDGEFRMRMLNPYDPVYDYQPWIQDVRRSAIAKYVQRANQRLISADLFGAHYLVSAPFEARLLARKGAPTVAQPAQVAYWADVPLLTKLSPEALASILGQDESVEDLRHAVRAAVREAESTVGQVAAVRETLSDIERASAKLEKKMRTERAYGAILPGLFSGGSIVVGGIVGGLPGMGVGALGGLAGLAPYLGSRATNKREASFVFVTARRKAS